MVQDLTGQAVGHYRIMRPIEQGGMATVYLARDIHLQREVAIKVFQSQEDQKLTQEFFHRFTREAQVVARLDHPNILLVHDYGEQDNLAYLVMPYLARGSLKNLLRERGRLPIPEALHLILQLLDALQYAHDRGLIHRDIKPGNILFKNDQTPVLADFGLVKEIVNDNPGEITTIGPLTADQQLPLSSGLVMGTPYYMAPEQIRGQVQPQSDIYSIGLVLYEMLTGQLPFVAGTQAGEINIIFKQIYEPPRPIDELNPSISPLLAEAIMHALEKNANRRYQRPDDFSQALRAASQLSSSPFAASEGTHLLNQSTSSSDPNTTLPIAPPDLQSSATLPSVERPSSPMRASNPAEHLPHSILSPATALLQTSQNSHPTWLRWRLSYVLYSLLATIVLATLLFAGITHFPALGFTSTPLSTIHSHNNNHSATTVTPTAVIQPTHAATTSSMPATQTSCPSPSTARAAVLAPYLPQGHNAFVYTVSSQDGAGKESGTLMRYDVVTGKSSSIVTVPDLLSTAQISGDGQWVIFSTYGYELGTQQTPKPSQIQMVRIDGKGLQTLYCSSSSAGLQRLLASPGLDASRGWNLFFADGSTMNVLNITNGQILQKFSSHHLYQPIIWLNDQDLYLLDTGTPSSYSPSAQFSLVLLSSDNTIAPSDPSFPVEVSIPALCSDLDFSPDLRTIFTSQCKGHGNTSRTCSGCPPNEGPSTIDSIKQDVQTSSGWSQPASIFTSSTLAIIQVRAITSSTLLLLIGNDDQYSNQNGLWKINTDGSGLQRLSIEKADFTMFNRYSQYPWSNVARDSSVYSFKTGSLQALGYDKLFIASLNGDQPTTIAQEGVGTIARDSQLEIAGWTTI